MNKVPHHEINLDDLEKLAAQGVSRAALFMGLGLNAAQREDFTDYELSKVPIDALTNHTAVTLVPPGADSPTVRQYKREFARWIISAGLGEVLEHYAHLLNHLHYHALVVFRVQGKGRHFGDFEAAQQNFVEASDVGEKINQLKQRFEVSTTFDPCIRSLNQLRNAITHNFGVIGPKQVTDNELVVEWYAFEMFMRSVDGGNPIPMRRMIGQEVAEEPEVTLKRLKREHRFKVGDPINLSREQLEEICLFFRSGCIPEIKAKFLDFLHRHQVPVNLAIH